MPFLTGCFHVGGGFEGFLADYQNNAQKAYLLFLFFSCFFKMLGAKSFCFCTFGVY